MRPSVRFSAFPPALPFLSCLAGSCASATGPSPSPQSALLSVRSPARPPVRRAACRRRGRSMEQVADCRAWPWRLRLASKCICKLAFSKCVFGWKSRFGAASWSVSDFAWRASTNGGGEHGIFRFKNRDLDASGEERRGSAHGWRRRERTPRDDEGRRRRGDEGGGGSGALRCVGRGPARSHTCESRAGRMDAEMRLPAADRSFVGVACPATGSERRPCVERAWRRRRSSRTERSTPRRGGSLFDGLASSCSPGSRCLVPRRRES